MVVLENGEMVWIQKTKLTIISREKESKIMNN